MGRFKTALAKTKTFDKLFGAINAQLEAHNINVKKGIIVNASIIDKPLRPKGKTNHKVTEDRSEEEVTVEKEYAESVDKDATWLKKEGNIILVSRSTTLRTMKGRCQCHQKERVCHKYGQ